MSELEQERLHFIEQLHEAFLTHKGHGAFAYISVTDALTLFDTYVSSGEPANVFINEYMKDYVL